MKSIGVVRKLDQVGRITLPIELRKLFGLKTGSELELFVDDNTIILHKFEEKCVFTESTDDLVEYNNKMISRNSIIELARLAGFNISE